MAIRPNRAADTLFALFHLAMIVVVIGYAVLSLARGDTWRFLVVAACLAIYYFLVLDVPVRREIARRRNLRRNPPPARS